MKHHQLLFVLISLFIFTKATYAQGWLKSGGGIPYEQVDDMIATADGGYLAVGILDAPVTPRFPNHGFVFKLNAGGQEEWSIILQPMQVAKVLALSNGTYVIVGNTGGPYDDREVIVINFDGAGQVLWNVTSGREGEEEVYDALISQDGMIVVCTKSDLNGTDLDSNTGLLKFNLAGDILWEKYYSADIDGPWQSTFLEQLQEDSEGNLIVSGSIFRESANKDNYLLKTDADGNELWFNYYEGPYPTDDCFQQCNDEFIQKTLILEDGYVSMGLSRKTTESSDGGSPDLYSYPYVFKTDTNGNFLWGDTISSLAQAVKVFDIQLTPQGNIWVLGLKVLGGRYPFIMEYTPDGTRNWIKTYTSGGFNSYAMHILFEGEEARLIGANYYGSLLYALDANGDELWTTAETFPAMRGLETYHYLRNEDGSFIVGGGIVDPLPGHRWDWMLYKMDAMGHVFTNSISGLVYEDEDEDCNYSFSDNPMSRWIVTGRSDSLVFYSISDTEGQFFMETDTGDYVLSSVMPSPYWELCAADTFTFDEPFLDYEKNLGVQKIVDCPYMVVDVSTSSLRRCMPTYYRVNYCNNGTSLAEEASISVEIDSFLIVDSTSLPIASQMGNTLTFELGDVASLDCGNINIWVTVDCDSTTIGQVHCVEARAFPNELCSTDSLWTGADVRLSARCEGDSVALIIKNEGTAPTVDDLEYLVIEDQVILFMEAFQLNPSDSIVKKFAANGGTFYFESQQEPFHPNSENPRLLVENCGGNNGPEQAFNLSYIHLFPQYDFEPFVSSDCRPNTDSYDPNDKQAWPLGWGETHLLPPNTAIDYQIRFQNTGTAPALTVQLRDTLSPYLDLSTIKLGASSHDYHLEIKEQGILHFIFNDINLPDSTTNLLASQGFVNFSIQQKKDLREGILIENKAAIYFDFNAPVITNTTLHTIGVPTFYDTLSVLLCAGDVYENISYENSTTIYDTIATPFLKNIQITDIEVVDNYVAAEICTGDSFIWQGEVYNQTGIYSQMGDNVLGCDSLFYLELTVHPIVATTIDTTLIQGETYQNIVYLRDTTFTEVFTATTGCDSMVTVNIMMEISSLERISTSIAVQIAPNPFDDITYFRIQDAKIEQVDLKVFDARGKLVLVQKERSDSFAVDASDLLAGLYFYQLVMNQKIRKSGKLLVK